MYRLCFMRLVISVYYLKKTPQDLLQRIYELSQEALTPFYKKHGHLQDQAGQDHIIAKAKSHHLSRTRGTLPSHRGLLRL